MVLLKPPEDQQEVHGACSNIVLKGRNSSLSFFSHLKFRDTEGIICLQNANEEGDVMDCRA